MYLQKEISRKTSEENLLFVFVFRLQLSITERRNYTSMYGHGGRQNTDLSSVTLELVLVYIVFT
jgi:hypothetical protein